MTKVVFVSVKVYEALVEEVSVFEKREDADEDLRKWKEQEGDRATSLVWVCPIEK